MTTTIESAKEKATARMQAAIVHVARDQMSTALMHLMVAVELLRLAEYESTKGGTDG